MQENGRILPLPLGGPVLSGVAVVVAKLIINASAVRGPIGQMNQQ